MKKLTVLLLALALLLSTVTGTAERNDIHYSDDPVALVINSHEITQRELKDAATLYMFEAALSCAGYGYGFDMLDPLNIEDEMDKLVFDLELWYTAQDMAESMGLYPLSGAAAAAAEEEAEAVWQHYREIAWSDNGMAFLPAGVYQYVENDPEGNITRYFASFGLTKDTLLQKAVWEQADEEIKKVVTAFMAGQSENDIIMYYSDWFLQKMDEQYILEDDGVISQVMEDLGSDPSENQDGDGYEAYERSILINGYYYTLGESTVRDFEQNGWAWTQKADGTFAFEITEEGNYFYVRTDNSRPDGKLVMVDLLYAYDIAYEYLGYGFDLAADPDIDGIYDWLVESYEGDYTDEGILQAQTQAKGGTLLIEVSEGALRLTLE